MRLIVKMHFECAIKVEKCSVSIDLFTNHLLFLTVANLNDYNLETVLFCYPNRTKNRHTG